MGEWWQEPCSSALERGETEVSRQKIIFRAFTLRDLQAILSVAAVNEVAAERSGKRDDNRWGVIALFRGVGISRFGMVRAPFWSLACVQTVLRNRVFAAFDAREWRFKNSQIGEALRLCLSDWKAS